MQNIACYAGTCGVRCNVECKLEGHIRGSKRARHLFPCMCPSNLCSLLLQHRTGLSVLKAVDCSFQGILPASLLNRLSNSARKSTPTTPTAVGGQTSHHLFGSYNELNYGASVSKSQFDSSSLSSSASLTSTAPSNTHSEPTRATFPYDSHFGNFQMPFGPFGHMPYYASYGMGMAANSQGSTSFGENAVSKQAQSPVSPSPSSSHVMFNNSYSSLYAGQQAGNGAQGYAPGMASNAFTYPLLNNGNLAASPLSSKGDLLPDSASHGSSSIGSDISSQSSPDNDC